MSDLSRIEKLKFEKLFEMGGGYVLDFSNRTFGDYIYEICNIDIYNSNYEYNGNSKANRLRAFWERESNFTVEKLIKSLLLYWREYRIIHSKEITPIEQELFMECEKICLRLKHDLLVEEIDIIKGNSADRSFSLLAKSIKESIERNEPEAGLDRLHTYSMKFFRRLCEKHNIEIKNDESLNAIFGKYVKQIVSSGKVESQMAERILKYSINVIEAFNDIRNNKSFAHDNPILNYHESVLIFNSVTNSMKFIEKLEESIENQTKQDSLVNQSIDWNNLPF